MQDELVQALYHIPWCMRIFLYESQHEILTHLHFDKFFYPKVHNVSSTFIFLDERVTMLFCIFQTNKYCFCCKKKWWSIQKVLWLIFLAWNQWSWKFMQRAWDLWLCFKQWHGLMLAKGAAFSFSFFDMLVLHIAITTNIVINNHFVLIMFHLIFCSYMIHNILQVQIWGAGKKEAALRVYFVMDSVDSCQIGFVPWHIIKHVNKQNGILVQVTDI